MDDTVSFAFEFVRTRLPYASRVPQKEGSGIFFSDGFSTKEGCGRRDYFIRAHGAKMESMHQEVFTRLMDLFVLIANERLCSWSLGSSRAEAFEFRIERF